MVVDKTENAKGLHLIEGSSTIRSLSALMIGTEHRRSLVVIGGGVSLESWSQCDVSVAVCSHTVSRRCVHTHRHSLLSAIQHYSTTER